MLNRRHFLALSAATASLAIAPASAFAANASDPRFMFIFLRGGMDGLSAVPTPNDTLYHTLRPSIGVSAAEALPLDDTFAFHPALSGLHEMFSNGEATVFHNISSPNRERSHFEAMRHLEQGGDTLDSINTGWLARTLSAHYGEDDNAGIALSQALQTSFLGAENVLNWAPSRIPAAPDRFLDQLGALYASAPALQSALADGRTANEIAAMESNAELADNETDTSMVAVQSGSPQDLARSAGQFLALDDGPRIAMMDIGGWDTHDDQNNDLNQQLPTLDQSLQLLKNSLGNAWQYTTVLVMTEFGRTVAENGTGGTDHGTAGAAFLLGGAVAGGQVRADWRGLAAEDLLDGRDLPPTTDARSVMKAILVDHLGMTLDLAESEVFPDSSDAVKMQGLFI